MAGLTHDWTPDFPTEPGLYEFYGFDSWGATGQDREPGQPTAERLAKREVMFVRVRRIGPPDCPSLVAVGNGRFVYSREGRQEGALGYWRRIDEPVPPPDYAGLFKPNEPGATC